MNDIFTVPVSKLDLRYGALRTLSGQSIQAMVRSMEKQGQLTPVVIAKDRFILIDGFKRQRAAEILGLDRLMVVALQCEEARMKAHMYLLNRKSGFSIVEEGMLVRELVEGDGLSQVEVSSVLDRHKSWVSRRLDMIRRLSAPVIEDLRMGLIPHGCAKNLARLPQCNQADFSVTIQTHNLQVMQANTLIDLWCKAKDSEIRAFLVDFPEKAMEIALGEDARVPPGASGWFKAVRCLERIAGVVGEKSKYDICATDEAVYMLLKNGLDKAEQACYKALSSARCALHLGRYQHEQAG